MRYKIEDIVALIGARRYGNAEANIEWLLTDSRSLVFPETSLFFAIKTNIGDGHNYINELYKRGVRNFVVTKLPDKYNEKYPGTNFLCVIDSRKALQRLSERHREQYNIPIQLLEYGSLRARTLVDNEQLDIAMANMDFYNLDKYNSYVMMEDRYVYCVSKTHRYAGEKEITMDMLKDEPIILFNTDSVQTQTVITRLRSAGITPNVHMYCSQLVTVLNFVRGGKCGAFLYSSLATNPRDFVVIPVSPEITSKFGIIWKKGVFVPDQLTKFVKFIQEYDVTPYLPKL